MRTLCSRSVLDPAQPPLPHGCHMAFSAVLTSCTQPQHMCTATTHMLHSITCVHHPRTHVCLMCTALHVCTAPASCLASWAQPCLMFCTALHCLALPYLMYFPETLASPKPHFLTTISTDLTYISTNPSTVYKGALASQGPP